MAQKKQQKTKVLKAPKKLQKGSKKVTAPSKKKVVLKKPKSSVQKGKKVVSKLAKKSVRKTGSSKKVVRKVVKKNSQTKVQKKSGFGRIVKSLLKKVAPKKSGSKKSAQQGKKVAPKKVAGKKLVVSKKSVLKSVKVRKPVGKVATQKKSVGGRLDGAKKKTFSVDKKEKKSDIEVTDSSVAQQAEPQHVSVLMKEVLEMLKPEKRRVVVDGTLGLGGHAKAILEKMPVAGKYIGFDLDKEHIEIARRRLKDYADQLITINDNFSSIAEKLQELKLKGVDAILLDLGMASPHVDDPSKGFSFLHEGPLDMRFNKEAPYMAADVVNNYSEKELMRIFREYGEEPKARRIAHEIAQVRRRSPFKTTKQLADFIEKHVRRVGHIHPATRVFQALRIEVNKELDSLVNVLKAAVEVLRPGGRIAVISYHSLEDRIVKHFFKEQTRDYVNLPGSMTTTKLEPTLDVLTRKPVVPSEQEVLQNPRSRSAKLRVAEKLKV